MTDDNLLMESQRKIEKLRHGFDLILLCDADVKAYRNIARSMLCECDCVSCAAGDHDECYYEDSDCWKRNHLPTPAPDSAGSNARLIAKAPA